LAADLPLKASLGNLADQGLLHALECVRLVLRLSDQLEGEGVSFEVRILDHLSEPDAATGERVSDSGGSRLEDGEGSGV
jgi:hypothetical protein